MEYKDYYKIMGVKHDATQNEIKRAYRKLARKYHPDVSQAVDAEERFKEVGEAYEVLKDAEKRAAYDKLGANWKAGQEFHPPPDWDDGFEFRGGGYTAGGHEGYSDFFEQLFGRGFAYSGSASGRQHFQMIGEDHHAKVLIDLEDSFTGAKRSLSLHMPKLTNDGHVVMQERTLNVRIPKGIRAGQQIRLAGQGSPGIGGAEPGNLYLEIEFREHPLYKVKDANIYLELPVAPWEAALGANIKVPTPSGFVDIKIPENSVQGRKLRLKGRGLPSKQPGDMFVILHVSLPPADNETAKSLYKQMKEQLDFNPRAKMEVV